MGKTILVADDEINIVKLIERITSDEDYKIVSASSAEEAIKLMNKMAFDLVISDLALPSMSGIEFLNYAKANYPNLPFIIITGYGTIETAVEAIKHGAFHYLTKPFQKDEFKVYVKKALEQAELYKELNILRNAVSSAASFENIVGKNEKMQELFHLVKRISDSTSTVLIEGESGTGKELFSRAIHRYSSREKKPFVTIHCAGIPETLLESELFGHVQGAFTGAVKSRKGMFEEANEGTIFLDEIGEFSNLVQTKLLRVIQEREIKPIGSNHYINVDVRLIAATNKDLKVAIEEKKFREDLYYRFAVIVLKIPPLRERKDDIVPLCEHFIKLFASRNNKKITGISPQTLSFLLEYSWPGNVRELENVIERAVLVTNTETITPADIPVEIKTYTARFLSLIKTGEPLPLKELVDNTVSVVEKEAIANALSYTNGNRNKAAKLLDVSPRMLYYKLKKYDMAETKFSNENPQNAK